MEDKNCRAVGLHGSGDVSSLSVGRYGAGGLEKVIAEVEAMGPGMLLFLALFCWWGPLVMAVLSLSLKDSANRWTNFILGIIFTLLNIFHLTEHFAQPSVHQILIVGSTVVVTALIAWYAWKWPKQEA